MGRECGDAVVACGDERRWGVRVYQERVLHAEGCYETAIMRRHVMRGALREDVIIASSLPLLFIFAFRAANSASKSAFLLRNMAISDRSS